MNQLVFVTIIMLVYLVFITALRICRTHEIAGMQQRKPSLKMVKAVLVCNAVLIVTAVVLMFVLPTGFIWLPVMLIILSGFIRQWFW